MSGLGYMVTQAKRQLRIEDGGQEIVFYRATKEWDNPSDKVKGHVMDIFMNDERINEVVLVMQVDSEGKPIQLKAPEENHAVQSVPKPAGEKG